MDEERHSSHVCLLRQYSRKPEYSLSTSKQVHQTVLGHTKKDQRRGIGEATAHIQSQETIYSTRITKVTRLNRMPTIIIFPVRHRLRGKPEVHFLKNVKKVGKDALNALIDTISISNLLIKKCLPLPS